MLKYNSILIKIKLFYLILKGNFKKHSNTINISRENGINAKNILVIFPTNDEDFRVAIYAFRKLSDFKNMNFYYLINCIHRQHFHLKGYVFDMNKNIKKNRIKIDETFYDSRTLNKEYDVIIDLNKEFNFDISLLINNLNGKYKIGMKKDYSDYLYNIQYNFSSYNILEKIYNQMFLILK